MNKAILGLVALVLSGGAAVAADQSVKSAPTSHDWTGWYVGGFAGGQSGAVIGAASFPLFNGIDAGVQVLYEKQLASNWVLAPFVIVPFPGRADSSAGPKITLNWALLGGARLGYAQGRWLPYGFLAAAVGNVSAQGGGTNTHFGFSVGAGFDYALNDRWSVGARYAYISMSPQSYYGGASAGWNANSIAATLTYKFH